MNLRRAAKPLIMMCALVNTLAYSAESDNDDTLKLDMTFLEFLGALVEEEGQLLDPVEVFGETLGVEPMPPSNTKDNSETHEDPATTQEGTP